MRSILRGSFRGTTYKGCESSSLDEHGLRANLCLKNPDIHLLQAFACGMLR